ncbi:MAG: hypothetical protein C4346_08675 [Chloroflexota bacterium]
MAHDHNRTLLSIGEVVAKLRRSYPDVSHSSLRFLEREGLIRATRTPGGHRLYSTADVERIRQIKAWQAQRLTLQAIRQRLAQLDRLPPPEVLAQEFVERAVAGDLTGAAALILEADDVGLSLVTVFGEVLRPALVEIGNRWEHGQLLVAQEKEISECARDLIAELTLRHDPGSALGPAIVGACVLGERHELGLRMICGLLRAEGFRVYYLGADVAAPFLLDAVRMHQPKVILLSAKIPAHLAAIHDAITTIVNGLAPLPAPPIVVGGQVAVDHPEMLRAWGAVPVTHDHPEVALQTIATLLTDPSATDEPAAMERFPVQDDRSARNGKGG